MFRDAFSNDPNLSSDKSQDQVDYENDSPTSTYTQPTEVQKQWLNSNKGAPVSSDRLINTKWELSLYLAGVSDKDPSNDLYGRRVNISDREREFDLGVECPEEPNVFVEMELLENNKCSIEKTKFTTGEMGEYKLSPDGKYLRVSMSTTGFQKTVQTTGSITNVFWTDEEPKVTKTSTTYGIPEGIVYADVKLAYGLPGQILMEKGSGVLRFEKNVGLVGKKMAACGKFDGKMITDQKDNEL